MIKPKLELIDLRKFVNELNLKLHAITIGIETSGGRGG